MHTPVLLNEVLKYLAPQDGGVYLDATFGAGGYSKAILSQANCKLFAIDRDQSTEKFAAELKSKYPERFNFTLGSFRDLKTSMDTGILFDGIVFDLGVSSMQIDDSIRGFSFLQSGPLDMRMDQTASLTAAEIVNTYSEKKLADIIFKFGDEKKSRKIAKAIIDYRISKRFETTTELANVIRQVVGKSHDKIDPATRTFQAIRMEVNDELRQVEEGLLQAKSLLKNKGKLLVVSFHSGEDIIVKRLFNEWCGHVPHPNRHMPIIDSNKQSSDSAFLFKGVMVPVEAEVASNSRARSAKMRGITRV